MNNTDIFNSVTNGENLIKFYERIVFSLGANTLAKQAADVLFYLIKIEIKSWQNDSVNMKKYGGWFLQSCSQIEHYLFMSSTIRRNAVNKLVEEGLIEVSRKGSINGVYRIRINKMNVKELLINNEDTYRTYHSDFRESIKQKCNTNRINYEMKIKRFEELNDYKYLAIDDFVKKGKALGFRDFELWLVAVISKGIWKYNHRKIEWKEIDLNNICKTICCSVNEGGKEKQEDIFFEDTPLQKIIDTCKMPLSDWMNSWSLSYSINFKELHDTNYYGTDYGKYEDKEYYFSDISNEISN